MARIGLNNFRYGILTEAQDGTPSYGGAKKPAKAISCSVEVSNNEAKLYADDVVAESDTSFAGGTVTMIRKSSDTAPYVGFGRVIVKMVNSVYKYKVEMLYKVKFSEPSQEDNTKGESVEFATSEMQGVIAQLANEEWSQTKTFDDRDDAIDWLETQLGGTN